MRQTALIDWMVEGDLVFHLRRADARYGSEGNPLLDPRYDAMVRRTMTEEERLRQVERLRRPARSA